MLRMMISLTDFFFFKSKACFSFCPNCHVANHSHVLPVVCLVLQFVTKMVKSEFIILN